MSLVCQCDSCTEIRLTAEEARTEPQRLDEKEEKAKKFDQIKQIYDKWMKTAQESRMADTDFDTEVMYEISPILEETTK